MSPIDIVTATATLPEPSSTRKLTLTATPMPATPPTAPAQPAATKTAISLTPQPIQYAAAVLEGGLNVLELAAPCFASSNARIQKHEETWILESSEFASCTTGEQVFPIADDIVSRIHRILSLYCDTTPAFSVEYISWIDAEGEPKRSIRGFSTVSLFSPDGLAQLAAMSGAQPLGSAVLQAMTLDSAVNEALTLHGDDDLGWSQVYDIVEFLGGVAGVTKAGSATAKRTRSVKQTANHYRHLGSAKKYPLPPTPPTLPQAGAFARSLLKLWIASRVSKMSP
jgi:hypothetical protein